MFIHEYWKTRDKWVRYIKKQYTNELVPKKIRRNWKLYIKEWEKKLQKKEFFEII